MLPCSVIMLLIAENSLLLSSYLPKKEGDDKTQGKRKHDLPSVFKSLIFLTLEAPF